MNVLYVAHRIPYPPDKGDKIRSYHQIRWLAERHRLALVCLADDKNDLRHVDLLRRLCASVDVVYRSGSLAKAAGLRALLSGGSVSVAAFESAPLRRVALERARQADVAVAFSSVMAPYVPSAAGIPRLMDFVDVDSAKWKHYAERHRWPASWIFEREADRLGDFEERVAREWDHSLVVSEREARTLRERVPDRPVTVLRNGVDLDYFRPADREAARPEGSPQIVFTGMMDYFPNVDGVRWFAEAVFPRVREAVPGATFVIVGRNPTPAVRRLSRQPGVVVTGAVADVRPHLASAAVAVAPLRVARGIQNKVLEAMASGIPVVGTSAAFEGLDAGEGFGVQVADEPRDFAARLVALLASPERRDEEGRRARAYVETRHRWEEHGAALEALLLRLVAEHARGRSASGTMEMRSNA